jgi:hypothetical protein
MDDRTRRIGLQTFFRILETWGLQEGEGLKLLGLDHMPEASALTVDQLERISHTLAIFRALHTLLNEASADAWVLKPNYALLFGGKTALDLLETGTQGFREVRLYLTGQIEGFE